MNSKANFLKEKELAAWWASIAHDDRFEKVLTYTQAVFLESLPGKDQTSGATRILNTLLGLADNTEPDQGLPSPGLYHMADEMPKPKTN